jgi:hypothetical protein
LAAVSAASGASWKEVKERRDFKVDDPSSVLESAYAELKGVYGPDLDIDALKKNKSYVHAIRSEEYRADILVVMIEDRAAGEDDCYYEVTFQLPDMNYLSVGGVWLDASVDEYLDSVAAEVFSAAEVVSGDEAEDTD